MRRIGLIPGLMSAALFVLSLSDQTFAIAAQERIFNFHIGYIEETLRVEGNNCEAILDDNSNFEVNNLGNAKFRIRALRLTETSAVLLVDCSENQYVYTLNYKNQDLNLRSISSVTDRYARSNSSLGTMIRHANSESTNFSISYSDSSWDSLHAFASQTYSARQSGSGLSSSSIDLMHLGNESALGYGVTQEFLENNRIVTLRVSSTLSRYTILANKQYKNGSPQNERYSIYLPEPIQLRLTYQVDRTSGEISKSLSRDFFYSAPSWRNNTSLQFAHIQRPDDNIQSTSWNNGLQYDWSRQISHQINTGFSCDIQESCLFRQIAQDLIFRKQSVEVIGTYSIIPHQIGLSSNWDFRNNSRVFANMTKKIPALAVAQKSEWFAKDGEGGDLDALSTARFGGSWGDLSGAIVAGQSQIFSQPTSTAGLEASYEQPNYRMDGGVAFATSSEMKGRWEFNAGYRRYFDPGLNALPLQIETHSLSGRVLSNFQRKPVAGAKVILKTDHQNQRTVFTENDGSYNFIDVRPSGDFEIVVQLERPLSIIEASSNIQKKINSVDLKHDIVLDNFAFVPVQFYIDTSNNEQVDDNDIRVEIENFNEMVEEGVVMVDGAQYEGNGIILERGRSYRARIAPEYLPIELSLIGSEGADFDLIDAKAKPIRVLLKRN